MKKSYIALLSAVLLAIFNTAYSQVPVINSFSPASGPVGMPVTISGSGFSTTPGNNVVLFGTTKATVTTATATKLTVLAPAGTTYAPFTVINKSTGLAATANRVFKITYSSTLNVSAPQAFNNASLEKGHTIGDVDGDGMLDVLMISKAGNKVDVYRNTTTPGSKTVTYSTRVEFSLATGISSVELTDLNGDGNPEIITVHEKALSVLRNTSVPGTLGFAAPVTVTLAKTLGISSSNIAVGDIDGDGKPDVAITHWGQVKLLRNTSSGSAISFNTPLLAPMLFNSQVRLADIDGDGKKDIIANSYTEDKMYIARNTATPGSINASSFAAPVIFVGPQTDILQIADMDGDNKTDIILGHAIYRNTGTPGVINTSTLAAPLSFMQMRNTIVLVNDVTGDGKPDMVSVKPYTVTVYKNLSTPGNLNYPAFPYQSFALTSSLYVLTVALGDVNGDGKQDLISPDKIVLNDAATFIKPVIVSFSPVKANPGATVTISGSNFGPTPAENIVYFGAVRAVVNTASATQLVVEVPVGATYEPISVLNTVIGKTGSSKTAFIATNPTHKPKIIKNDFDAVVSLPAAAQSDLLYQKQLTAIKDLNGDGKPEIISLHTNGLSIYQNNTTGGTITAGMFTRVNLPVPNILGFAAGDLDNDGKPDIVIVGGATFETMYVAVLRNINTGGNITLSSFAAPVKKDIGRQPSELTTQPMLHPGIIDIDNDGVCDIVLTGLSGGMYRNISTPGNMTAATLFTGNGYTLSNYIPVLADFNLDGKPDNVNIVYARVFGPETSGISYALNSSIPGVVGVDSFREREFNMVLVSRGTVCAATGDFNGDGRPDLLNGIQGVELIQSISTDGVLTLQGVGTIPSANVSRALAAGDINGDGKPDIVQTSRSWVNIYTNTYSSGDLEPSIFLAETADFDGATSQIADIDGDGIPDLVNADPQGVYIVRYNPAPALMASATAKDIEINAMLPYHKTATA